MKTIQLCLAIFSLLFLGACTKEGPIGPQGETGATGTTGATGNTGATGQNGQDGEDANVTGRNFTITYNDWYHAGVNGDVNDRYVADLSASLITQSIMNYGAVMVYYSWDQSHYFPMAVVIYPSSSYETTYTYFMSLGALQIQRYDNDYNTIPPSSDMYIKVVVIDGHARQANPNLDWNNYDLVKRTFGLKD